MSKSTSAPRLVPASRVREAFNQGLFTAPDEALPSLVGKKTVGVVRGRLHPSAIAAFNEQVKGEQYAGEKSPVEGSKTITLPLTKMNAKGARLKRPEDFPMKEVRRLAGVPNKKGRLSAAEVEKAAQAVIAERGWDKPAQAVSKPKATKGTKAKAEAPVTK